MQGLNSHKLIFPYRNVVSYLLQTSQWPTLLRQSWEKHPKTTPFRELIKKMPGKVKPKQHRAWCLCQKLALFPRLQFWFYLTMTVMKRLFSSMVVHNHFDNISNHQWSNLFPILVLYLSIIMPIQKLNLHMYLSIIYVCRDCKADTRPMCCQ